MQIISHYMAFGHGNQTCSTESTNFGTGVTRYHDSLHAHTISGHVNSTIAADPDHISFPLILFLTDWQDEFDKNNIIRNKYQIFLRTLTILTQGKRGVLERHTFIVALGSKGDSRFTLDEIYNEDLKRLSRIHEVYDGRNKKNIKVMAILVASLEDRIERSGMLFIGQQNQSFCSSFGHSTYLHNLSKLPSCKVCFKARIESLSVHRDGQLYDQGSSSCTLCADWFVLCDNGALDVRVDTLPDYPTEVYPGSPAPPAERPVGPHVHVIGPMRLGFPELRCGADFAFYNFHYSRTKPGRPTRWNIKKMEFYVKSIGLNTAFGKMIREAADKYKDLEANIAMDKFRKEVHPPSWNRPHSGLSAHLEATFHCVFRGLVPDHVEICLATMKLVTAMKPVHHVFNRILKTVKQMNLPRMNVSLFGKGKHNKLSMAGWQGSQENAFSKLMVHILLHCRIHADRPSSVTEEVMSKTFDLLEKATFAFYCTIARIMSVHITTWLPDETLQYAKLYLSYLTDVEKLSLVDGKSPVWKRTGNHVGLLNIPEVMRRYGPVHTYYEAADETTIQWMKPMVKNVSTTSHTWKATVLDAITREQTLAVVSEDVRNLITDEEIDELGWNPYDFRVSRNLNELKNKFLAGEALSAFSIDGVYPLLPYWGLDMVTSKRKIKYMVAKEYLDDAEYKGGIRYACFDSVLFTPPSALKAPETMVGIRDNVQHIYIFLFFIPKNGTCVQGDRMQAHVCGLNWDVIDTTTNDLVTPNWCSE
jgi:hypothetical protein